MRTRRIWKKRLIKSILICAILALYLRGAYVILGIVRRDYFITLGSHERFCHERLSAITRAVKYYREHHDSIPLINEHWLDMEICLKFARQNSMCDIEEDIDYYLSCSYPYLPYVCPEPQPYRTRFLTDEDVQAILTGKDSNKLILMERPGVHIDGGGVIFADLSTDFIKCSISDYKRLYELFHFGNHREYIKNPSMKMRFKWEW